MDGADGAGADPAAMRHPVRHQLMLALGPEGATISQLARMLGLNKGSVAHHLRVLVEAKLVHLLHTRTGRGGTALVYGRSADSLTFDGDREATRAMLQLVGDGVLTDPWALLSLRQLRLTPQQARRLAQQLDSFIAGIEPATSSEPAYAVLVSVHRAAGPVGQ